MNYLSTATIERNVRDILQDPGLLEGRTVSLDWRPHGPDRMESELWDLLIALASNDDEAGTLGLAPTLRRLRESGARLVSAPNFDEATTQKIRLTAGGMSKRDYQIVRRRHLMPHAGRVAGLLKTVAFAATDPLTRAAIESGARVNVVGLV